MFTFNNDLEDEYADNLDDDFDPELADDLEDDLDLDLEDDFEGEKFDSEFLSHDDDL